MTELTYYKKWTFTWALIAALTMFFFCYVVIYRGYTDNILLTVMLAVAVAVPAALAIQFFEDYQIFKESFRNFHKVKVMERNHEIISVDMVSKPRGLKCGLVYYKSPAGNKQRILINCSKVVINKKEDSTFEMNVEKDGELILSVPSKYFI